MDQPFSNTQKISVTIKGDGKDATWVVFHGSASEIRSQIIDVFGLSGEITEGALSDLIIEATRVYKAQGNVSSALGGRVVNSSKKTEGANGGGSAWDRASTGNGAEPQEPEVDPNVTRLTGEIEAATDVAKLKELYARNVAHFDANPELLAAYKAKGKALSGK